MYYTQVLEKLAAEDYGFELDSLLELLDKNERFRIYQSEAMKDSAIWPVDSLMTYVSGRRKEYERDLEGAMAEYGKSLGFFDSDDRYTRIRNGFSALAYEEAVTLLREKNYAGAYFAFARANGYLDSWEQMARIESLIGYTPADANDNPGSVTGLRMAVCAPNYIMLAWNEAEHVGRYEVEYRRSGTETWRVTETAAAEMTVEGLEADSGYDFRVTAVAGSVRTESAMLAGVRTALILQAPGRLRVLNTDPTGVTIAWNSVPYANGYRVMVKEQGLSEWREEKYTTGTTAQITQLRAGKGYQIKVAAENGSARAESESISVIMPTPTPSPTPTPTPTPSPTPKPSKATVLVRYVDENGNELSSWNVEMAASGEIKPDRIPDGYYMTASNKKPVKVTVTNGVPDPAVVTFICKKKSGEYVTVVYFDIP